MDATQTILLADEDHTIRAFLADNLAADGYATAIADDLDDAMRQLEHARPAAVIADLNGGTLTLVDKVRAAEGLSGSLDPGTPLMILSRQPSELDRLRGYQRGCDDYLAKPFSYPELLARLRRLLARTHQRANRPVRVGELMIDPAGHEVRLRDRRVELTPQEFALLRTLASEPERVFTKEELLRGVWGFKSMGRTRTVDSHACRLRRKLTVDGDRYLVNVWGVGYRLLPAP